MFSTSSCSTILTQMRKVIRKWGKFQKVARIDWVFNAKCLCSKDTLQIKVEHHHHHLLPVTTATRWRRNVIIHKPSAISMMCRHQHTPRLSCGPALSLQGCMKAQFSYLSPVLISSLDSLAISVLPFPPTQRRTGGRKISDFRVNYNIQMTKNQRPPATSLTFSPTSGLRV